MSGSPFFCLLNTRETPYPLGSMWLLIRSQREFTTISVARVSFITYKDLHRVYLQRKVRVKSQSQSFTLQIYGKKIKYQSFFFNFFAIFSNPLCPIPLRAIMRRVFGDKIIITLPAIYPILSNRVPIEKGIP